MISSKYIILLFLSIATLGYAQDSDCPQRTFDVKAFIEDIKDGEYRYNENDSTVVVRSAISEYFLETRIINGSQKKILNSYTSSGKLYISTETYCDVPVGITRWYNEEGNLIEEVNEDAPYKFSMDGVREIIKKELKIDILYPPKRYNITILRLPRKKIPNISFPDVKYYYDIDIMTGSKGMIAKSHQFIIDATTGKVLSHIDEEGNQLITKKLSD